MPCNYTLLYNATQLIPTYPHTPKPVNLKRHNQKHRLPNTKGNDTLAHTQEYFQTYFMKNLLVLTALGKDRPGLVAALSESITSQQCNISESCMSVLGGEFAIIMLVEGQWNNIAKLEQMIPGLQEQLSLTLQCKRTETRPGKHNAVPYTVDVLSMDSPGIVHKVTDFFYTRKINIHDLQTECFNAAHTGTPMFTLTLTLEIPAVTHIATLREEFMDFSDTHNLDAIIEPVKTH